MRFSIRDLLWATLVVGIGLGWWLSYRAIDAKRIEAVGQAHRQRATLELSRGSYERLRNGRSGAGYWKTIGGKKEYISDWWHVDWSVLDEPLVEP